MNALPLFGAPVIVVQKAEPSYKIVKLDERNPTTVQLRGPGDSDVVTFSEVDFSYESFGNEKCIRLTYSPSHVLASHETIVDLKKGRITSLQEYREIEGFLKDSLISYFFYNLRRKLICVVGFLSYWSDEVDDFKHNLFIFQNYRNSDYTLETVSYTH